MASITFTGNLAQDPEVEFTKSGIPVAKLRVVENHRRPDGRGGWEDNGATTWFVDVWGSYGENVAESLTKGSRVKVEGTIRQESYEKDGETRYATRLKATDVSVPLKFHTVQATKAPRAQAEPETGE